MLPRFRFGVAFSVALVVLDALAVFVAFAPVALPFAAFGILASYPLARSASAHTAEHTPLARDRRTQASEPEFAPPMLSSSGAEQRGGVQRSTARLEPGHAL